MDAYFIALLVPSLFLVVANGVGDAFIPKYVGLLAGGGMAQRANFTPAIRPTRCSTLWRQPW